MPLFFRRCIYGGKQSDPLESRVTLLGRWKHFIGGQMYLNKYSKRSALEHGSILLATASRPRNFWRGERLVWPMRDSGLASGRMGKAPKRNSEGL